MRGSSGFVGSSIILLECRCKNNFVRVGSEVVNQVTRELAQCSYDLSMNIAMKARDLGLDPWDIDVGSGHGARGRDIHVCFDPIPTSSGAIKAVGPFGIGDFDCKMLIDELRQATLAIEKAMSGYVVWGEYHDEPEYDELQICILGSCFGFYPNLAMRSSLLFSQPCDLAVHGREWDISEGTVSHKSNVLSSSQATIADLSVLHPTNFVQHLDILSSLAVGYFGESLLRVPCTTESWTPVK